MRAKAIEKFNQLLVAIVQQFSISLMAVTEIFDFEISDFFYFFFRSNNRKRDVE